MISLDKLVKSFSRFSFRIFQHVSKGQRKKDILSFYAFVKLKMMMLHLIGVTSPCCHKKCTFSMAAGHFLLQHFMAHTPQQACLEYQLQCVSGHVVVAVEFHVEHKV